MGFLRLWIVVGCYALSIDGQLFGDLSAALVTPIHAEVVVPQDPPNLSVQVLQPNLVAEPNGNNNAAEVVVTEYDNTVFLPGYDFTEPMTVVEGVLPSSNTPIGEIKMKHPQGRPLQLACFQPELVRCFTEYNAAEDVYVALVFLIKILDFEKTPVTQFMFKIREKISEPTENSEDEVWVPLVINGLSNGTAFIAVLDVNEPPMLTPDFLDITLPVNQMGVGMIPVGETLVVNDEDLPSGPNGTIDQIICENTDQEVDVCNFIQMHSTGQASSQIQLLFQPELYPPAGDYLFNIVVLDAGDPPLEGRTNVFLTVPEQPAEQTVVQHQLTDQFPVPEPPPIVTFENFQEATAESFPNAEPFPNSLVDTETSQAATKLMFDQPEYFFTVLEGTSPGTVIGEFRLLGDADISLDVAFGESMDLFEARRSAQTGQEGVIVVELIIKGMVDDLGVIDRETESIIRNGGIYRAVLEVGVDNTLMSAPFAVKFEDIDDNAPALLTLADEPADVVDIVLPKIPVDGDVLTMKNLVRIVDRDLKENSEFVVELMLGSDQTGIGLVENLAKASLIPQFYIRNATKLVQFLGGNRMIEAQATSLSAMLSTAFNINLVGEVVIAPLKFKEEYYEFEIPENSVNQHIIGIAEIPGLSEGLAQFSVSGIDVHKFHVDSMGNLLLNCGPTPFCLDYEEKTIYKLTVSAVFKDRRLVVPVQITVLDLNDNPPHGRVFPQPEILLDNGKLLRPVYIQGLDSDSEDNGAIEFSLLDSSVSNFFKLVNAGKDLAYIEPVDGGPSQSCNPCFLIVQLQDKGEPPLASLLNISVSASGIPMGKIRFSKPMSSVTILDPYSEMIVERSGISLSGLEDSADGAPLEVVILAGNNNALFSLNNNGDLVIVKNLDIHESNYGLYDLKLGVLRRDSQEIEAEMDVMVEVLEPLWDVQVVEVSKDTQLGQPLAELAGGKMTAKQVTQVKAEYFDGTGTLINVEKDPFSFNANGLQLFLAASLAESSVSRAQILWTIVFEELDGTIREKSVEFLIFVLSSTATTSGSTLEGVFFPPWSFETPVVNVKHGSQLISGQVIAVLPAWDSKQNLLLTEYSISGNDSHYFNIDEFGVIRASDTVFNSTMLEVTAGSTKAILNITLDANSAPVLNHTQGVIMMDVSEDALPGQVIASLSLPTKFGYELQGMGHDNFNVQVKENEVAITLASNANLDHEKVSKFFIVLRAKRGKDTAGTIPIQITVMDINDNAPEFEKSIHKTQILENWPIGSTVYRLTALDLDEGSNGNVSYSLVEGDESFSIDEQTGEVKTLRPLFGMSKPEPYRLEVKAADAGEPPKLATTALEITVVQESDMQDGIRFSKPPPNFRLKMVEDVPVGTVIYSARATDPELDVLSRSKVKFTLADTGDYRFFSINAQTGELRNTVVLDREVQQDYSITIMVSSGSKSAGRILHVELWDIDDHIPMFDRMSNAVPSVWRIPYQSTNNKSFIGSISAIDQDSDKFSDTYYYITGGDDAKYFGITKNGSIVQRRSFDAVAPFVFNLTILATPDKLTPDPQLMDFDQDNKSMAQIMLVRNQQSMMKKMQQFTDRGTVFTKPMKWTDTVFLSDAKTQSQTGLQLVDVGNAINGMSYSLETVSFKGFYDRGFNELDSNATKNVLDINPNTGEVLTGSKLVYGQPGSYKAIVKGKTGNKWNKEIQTYAHFVPKLSQTRVIFNALPDTLTEDIARIRNKLSNIIASSAADDVVLWLRPVEPLGDDRSSFCFFAVKEQGVIWEANTTKAIRSQLPELTESIGLLDVVPCTDIKHRIETSASSQDKPGTAIILLCVLAIALALALVILTMCFWCCNRSKKEEDETDSSSMVKPPLQEVEEVATLRKKTSTQTLSSQNTVEARPPPTVSMTPLKNTDYEWKEKTCKMMTFR